MCCRFEHGPQDGRRRRNHEAMYGGHHSINFLPYLIFGVLIFGNLSMQYLLLYLDTFCKNINFQKIGASTYLKIPKSLNYCFVLKYVFYLLVFLSQGQVGK